MYLETQAIDYFKNFELGEKFFRKFALEKEGFFSSRRIGSSMEFEEYKEYQPPDDARNIDWKKFARSGKLLTKLYESFAHIKVNFLLDISNSMNFPPALPKIEIAKKFIAIFSYLLLKNQNEVFLSLATEDYYEAGKLSFENLEMLLSSVKPEGRLSKKAFYKIKEGGLYFFISDGWWQDDFYEITKILISKRINFFHFLSKVEQEFSLPKTVNLIDSETKQQIFLRPAEIKEKYFLALKERINFLYNSFIRYSLFYQLMFIETPYYHNLKNFLDVV